jgi:hypothetical protein
MDQSIKSKNEAIARFMGSNNPSPYEWQYHESWDALMPVIEKISKIRLLDNNCECIELQDVCYPRTFGMPNDDGKQVMVRFNGFSLFLAPTLIDAAYLAVFEVVEYELEKQKEGL